MDRSFWRETINSRAFALAEFCIVVVSGAALCLTPRVGVWAIAVSLIPWGFRFSVGESLFRRRRLDLLLAIFLLTAGVGYWASYDQTAALHKLYLIVASVLLYYALRSQPKENLVWISAGFFSLGVGIAVYFFLTHDFASHPRKVEIVNQIGRLIMWVRPEFGWRALHPNYVAGFAAITAPFGCYLLMQREKRTPRNARINQFIMLGLFLLLSAMVMTTSRGILMAVVAAAGVWLMWRIVHLIRTKFGVGIEAAFPHMVLIFLIAVVILLYMGPAKNGSSVTESDIYGDGSRAELFTRSLYLVADFPVTGGGLVSFPGLYSQYILGIPSYFVPNAHNLFLDVFIEQGIFGGAAFLLLYFMGIWRASRNVASAQGHGNEFFNWVVLVSLVIAFVHGLVDDYLYNGSGTILSIALLGIIPEQFETQPKFERAKRHDRTDTIILAFISIMLISLILIYGNTIRSVWYSNLGAVQMARVELVSFPTDQWAGLAMVEYLQDAETSLLASLEADSANRTANHRLGLIALLRQDFPSAERYLSNAYRQAPSHRGIIKSLGFCYTWLGELERAKALLEGIPEASSELDVYTWWWQAQGRNDTSNHASIMRSRLISSSSQP